MMWKDGLPPVTVLPRQTLASLQERNNEWKHLKNQDIILMPDKWEYP
ncbi:MAG: hypothetical protein ABI863_22500 [Ginsengibacter sp.]